MFFFMIFLHYLCKQTPHAMERTESMDFIVLNLGHAQTVHEWRNNDISSPFVRIIYVKQGSATLYFNNGSITATAGHMYLIPSYLPHSYVCQPEFEFYYLFILQRRDTEQNIFEYYDFPTEVRTNEATQLLFENYCMLYPQLNLPSKDAESFINHQAYRDYAQAYMQMEHYERMQLHGLVEIIFSYFMKHATPRPVITDERIARIITFVQQNLSRNITIDELADLACLTKSHLIRAFRSAMGTTPLQYILEKKIQKAQNLLLSTTLSVNAIASQTGFDDPSYFIRIFKKHLGFTPREYRDKLIG